jgi:hypothetical protein
VYSEVVIELSASSKTEDSRILGQEWGGLSAFGNFYGSRSVGLRGCLAERSPEATYESADGVVSPE